MSNEGFLVVKDLTKHFPVLEKGVFRSKQVGVVHACCGVSFSIQKGETLGLVGESGCGKTTTSKTILNLIPRTSGEVYLDGENVFEIFASRDKEKKMKLRRKMQLIFQNPQASLNPRMTIFDIVVEPLIIHRIVPKDEYRDRCYELLRTVGLEKYHAQRYPHQLSGGQRQRVCIARALALNPEFLIADEPVSALDVSVRAQILNLLKDLQSNLNLTMLYISHDLSSVKYVCDKVAVMYLGRLIEIAETEELFANPLHPYTQALISAIPVPDPGK
ncbi:MAG: ABC transporter ATP-binding protein, partial [Candidatus Baldrarchaeia archaeon]